MVFVIQYEDNSREVTS